MKFIKRLFLLVLFIAGALVGYAQYKNLAFTDYEGILASLQQDVSDWVAASQQAEAESSEEVEITEQQNLSSEPAPKKRERLRVPANPYSQLDRYVRACPTEAEVDVATLAAYLGERASSDIEKARAIYIWLTDNIYYDDEGFNTGNYSDTSPSGVLANRTSVCDGYSSLFFALGYEMDLDVLKITGYAKGYGYQPGKRFSRSDHAWNAVRIDNEWRIFDATWGAGNGKSVNGNLVSTQVFEEYWFDVDPYEAIFNHYPEDPAYTFVEPSLSLRQYEQFPYVRKGYHQLMQNGKQIYNSSLAGELTRFPDAYSVKTYLKTVTMPLERELELGQSYSFVLQAPEAEAVALIDAEGNWEQLEDDYGEFSVDYQPTTTGELKLGVKTSAKQEYAIVLVYEVVGQVQ